MIEELLEQLKYEITAQMETEALGYSAYKTMIGIVNQIETHLEEVVTMLEEGFIQGTL